VAASEAVATFDLDRVLFVPAGKPWQKSLYSESEDRFVMTVLAAASHPRFAVSRLEIDRGGPTYTVDTLNLLRDFYEGVTEFFFILGADAALNLGTWHGLERLRGLTHIVAATRPGFDLEGLQPGPSWPDVITMEIPDVHVSSTEIRERVRSRRPIDFLVPADVGAYIRQRGLYTTQEEVGRA
jgi:nicotinate-nucleotide adenylyltransferase